MRLFGKSRRSAVAGTILQIGLLLAFVSQSFVTQTHIHASSLVVSASIASGNHGKAPLDKDDAAHCPLCQAVAQAGHLLTPASLALPVPQTASIIVARAIIAEPALIASRHDWFGRAPPFA